MSAQQRMSSDERETERAQQIDAYAKQVVADAAPMTADERKKIVSLLRPTARRLREQTPVTDDVA